MIYCCFKHAIQTVKVTLCLNKRSLFCIYCFFLYIFLCFKWHNRCFKHKETLINNIFVANRAQENGFNLVRCKKSHLSLTLEKKVVSFKHNQLQIKSFKGIVNTSFVVLVLISIEIRMFR